MAGAPAPSRFAPDRSLQEPAERRATLITAIGEQERKRRGCRAPDEVQEELETRLIAPMEIFNENEEGPLPGQSTYECPHFMEEALPLLLGIEVKRGGGGSSGQVGSETQQSRRDSTQTFPRFVWVVDGVRPH